MQKDYLRFLESESKNFGMDKDIFDIIVYGSIIKGKIEARESKLEAAKRELNEETGLRLISMKKFDFSGEYLYEKPLKDRHGLIGQTFSLFAAEVKKGKVTLDSKEHSGHKWFSFSAAEEALTWPNQKISLVIVNDWLK